MHVTLLTVSITTGRGLVHHEVASQRLSGCELIAQALELMVKRMYKVGSTAFTRCCSLLAVETRNIEPV